jgi:hypothetical protein
MKRCEYTDDAKLVGMDDLTHSVNDRINIVGEVLVQFVIWFAWALSGSQYGPEQCVN